MDKLEKKSSMRFFNFEGMSLEKAIEKYEELLYNREKQISDLSTEVGSLNERLSNCFEKIKQLENDNKYISNKLLKKETLLTQELTNKEIMFVRMQNLEKENDKLMQQLHGKGFDISQKLANIANKYSIQSNNKDENTSNLVISNPILENNQPKSDRKSRLASESINYDPVFK